LDKIYIKKIGLGKRNLVLLHGWGFNHTILIDLCRHLQEDFTCYLVDLPGYGFSSFCSDQEWFEILHSRLPKTFDLLGWSLGGLYAIKYAAMFPRDVTNLYLLATSPYFIKDSNWPGIDYQAFREFQQQLSQNPEKTLSSFINIHSKGSIPRSWQYIPPDISALTFGVEALITWDLREALTKLPHKIVLTLGRLDKIVPMELASTMQNNYPQITTNLLSKTGHMPFLTHKVRCDEKNILYWYRD
jgi:pimeloyl-[acyl-carrier protein] methyl ester esterase